MSRFSELPTQIQKYYRDSRPKSFPSEYIKRITIYRSFPQRITITLIKDVKDRWISTKDGSWRRLGR